MVIFCILGVCITAGHNRFTDDYSFIVSDVDHENSRIIFT